MNVHLITLSAKVAAANTHIEAEAISKALVKISKLAKSIQKRDAMLLNYYGSDLTAWKAGTQIFYNKAYALAKSIGCEFVGDPEQTMYWLRVNNRQERIV